MNRAFVALAFAVAVTVAHAGRPCEHTPQRVTDVQRGMALAAATAARLDASGSQVVVLARAGQDLSKYGLTWSHFGFAYREGDGAKSYWRVVHKLNHCGTAQAALYRQGLAEFFLDRPQRYEAAFVELSAETQAGLLPLLRDNRSAALMHEPRYNMVAYPPLGHALSTEQPMGARDVCGGAGAQRHRPRPRASLAAAARLRADHAAHRPSDAPGRAHDARQHRLRRPPEPQAVRGSHRNRHGRLGVRVAATQRTWRAAGGGALRCRTREDRTR